MCKVYVCINVYIQDTHKYDNRKHLQIYIKLSTQKAQVNSGLLVPLPDLTAGLGWSVDNLTSRIKRSLALATLLLLE